jgi:hypothetical protein
MDGREAFVMTKDGGKALVITLRWKGSIRHHKRRESISNYPKMEGKHSSSQNKEGKH